VYLAAQFVASSTLLVPDVRERRVMEGAISSANGNFVASYVVYGLIGVLAAYRSYLLQRNAILRRQNQQFNASLQKLVTTVASRAHAHLSIRNSKINA